MQVTTEQAWTGFRSKLFAYIRARSRTTEDADDILQDVFVKVHRRIGTLEDDGRVGAWLYRLTHNTIVDYYRKKVPIPTREDPPATSQDVIPIAEQSLAPFLRILIDDLPDHYRKALTLTELRGLTQAEMASQLGLSPSGAKSRVQRGRALLRKQLLACCHVDLDCRGRVIDYEAREPERWPEDCPCGQGQSDRELFATN